MQSLVARLSLVICVALAPALAFEAFAELQAWRARQQLMHDEAFRLVRLVAGEERQVFAAADQLLSALARAPSIKRQDPDHCGPLLAAVVDELPRYLTANAFGSDGHLICGTRPAVAPFNVFDHPYFRAALDTEGVVVGELTIGRISGQPALHIARSFRDAAGAVAGVVTMAISGAWLQHQLEQIPLPPGAAACIVDRDGRIIARVPPAPGYVGNLEPEARRHALATDETSVVWVGGIDGIQRLIGSASIGATGVRVEAGLQPDLAFPLLQRDNQLGILLIVAGMAFALVAALFLARRLISRPVDHLLKAAARWTAGDLAARTGLAGGGGEFGRLAAAFDGMAAMLAAREQALHTALESTTDAVVVLDRAWRFTYMSGHAKALVGRDLSGQIIWDAIPEIFGPPLYQAFQRAMQTGQPAQAGAYCAALKRYLETNCYPSNAGLTVFCRDVTAQREAEAALRLATERFELALRAAPIVLFSQDCDLRYTWIYNPPFHRASDVIGRTDRELFLRAEDAAVTEAITHQVIQSGAGQRREVVRQGPTGELRYDLLVEPLRNERGQICGVICAAIDITERVRIEAELRDISMNLEKRVREEVAAREAAQLRAAHAERMQALGQLAGGIAHDFNNVLQGIVFILSLIRRRPDDPAEIRQYAEMALEAGARGGSITRRLLGFARRGDLQVEPVDAAELLAGVQELLAHTLGANIDITIRCEDGLPLVLADRGQLETTLINLGTNARDAMPLGGRLVFAADTETVSQADMPHRAGLAADFYIRLTVADTGSGMDAATLARAAEPFFTTKGLGAGTGLGLSMAKAFAEQSGGALWIASTQGEGTAITLWLPSANEPAMMEGLRWASAPSADDDAEELPKRILLVDDDKIIREILAVHLSDAGFAVIRAASGAEAIRLLDHGLAADALVIDLVMPGLDGLSVIRAAQQRHPRLPAILLTGFAGDDTTMAMHGAMHGSFSLVRKPVQEGQLIERLRGLLAAQPHVD